MQIDVAKLREARRARGMSQEEAADAAGVSPRTVQRIEAGQPPSFESARALAALFASFGTDIRMTGKPADEAPAPVSPRNAGGRWSRRGIMLGGIGSLAGMLAGFRQGSMTSAELGAGLGLLGLGVGLCFLIVELLERKFYR